MRAFGLVLALLLGACKGEGMKTLAYLSQESVRRFDRPGVVLAPGRGHWARLYTARGEILLDLPEREAPDGELLGPAPHLTGAYTDQAAEGMEVPRRPTPTEGRGRPGRPLVEILYR